MNPNVPVTVTATPLELAYLAGIFDGEGCVGVWTFKRSGRTTPQCYRLSVIVGMQNREALDVFQRAFSPASTVRSGDRSYRIAWNSYRASSVLEALLPYLRVKKTQAQLGIMFQQQMKNPRRQGWTAEAAARNELFRRLISELNKRDSRLIHGNVTRDVETILQDIIP